MHVFLKWDLPAEAAHVVLARRTVRLLLEQYGIADPDIDDVEVVLGELCANVVRHAYGRPGGRYTVEASLNERHLSLRVSDNGSGFDVSDLPKDRVFSENGGMGLFLMGQFADTVRFHPADGGGSAVVAERTLCLR